MGTAAETQFLFLRLNSLASFLILFITMVRRRHVAFVMSLRRTSPSFNNK
jgi:hypothetical protein